MHLWTLNFHPAQSDVSTISPSLHRLIKVRSLPKTMVVTFKSAHKRGMEIKTNGCGFVERQARSLIVDGRDGDPRGGCRPVAKRDLNRVQCRKIRILLLFAPEVAGILGVQFQQCAGKMRIDKVCVEIRGAGTHRIEFECHVGPCRRLLDVRINQLVPIVIGDGFVVQLREKRQRL
jgi:hypothetical protein